MTTNWILPEGIDEALPAEAMWIETVRRELIDLYRSWGYELLMPPFIEYLDSLLVSSPLLDLQTFKLTDQLTGKMMGVRADMTPQVARIDAHRLKNKTAARYCYLGTVLKTRPDNFAGSRSPLQVGVELYGHSGIESDFEVIRLMLETLHLCEIKNLHIDLGHMAVFNGLAEQAGLEAADAERVFQLLQRKAVTDLSAFLAERDMPGDVATALLALPELNGGADVFAQARALTAFSTDSMHSNLLKLEGIAALIGAHYPDVVVNFDLAELSGYRYQKGVVFAAYIPGEGRELARGGRYDGIGESFGKSRAATGFSADLKNLMRLSPRSIASSGDRILAPQIDDEALRNTVDTLRAKGHVVIYAVGDENHNDFNFVLRQKGEDWQLEPSS